MRLSLFRQLEAPDVLIKQLPGNIDPVKMQWQIGTEQADLILAAFASYYADRYYVKDDLETTASLMKYVKTWKKRRMNQREKKLWWAANAIPHSLVMRIKKLKSSIK